MELLRFTKNMFGQKMLVGVNWEFLWLPVAAAFAVIAVHLLVRAARRHR